MRVSSRIERPRGGHLGENWLLLSYHINVALYSREIIRLATWHYGHHHFKLRKILPLLRHSKLVQLVRLPATVLERPKKFVLWKYPLIPTKKAWNLNSSRKICYQFDASKKRARFFSKKIERKILLHAEKLGYKLVRLGKNITLEKCVDEVSTSELFLGVDSGMLHLAASVGTPTILCENNRKIKSSYNQANKSFILTRDHVEMRTAIDNYYNGGLEYYIANARNIEIFDYNKS